MTAYKIFPIVIIALAIISCNSDSPTKPSDGNNEELPPLNEWKRLTNNAAVDFHPSWSPTMDEIIFDSNRDGP